MTKKLIYIILSIIVLLTIIIMLLIHTFNNTKISIDNISVSSTKYIIRGE